jgi:flagellar biosynthesis/type III secretory pathway chaperone
VIDAMQPKPTPTPPQAGDLDSQLADLLRELSDVQGDLLRVLAEKRQFILRGDTLAMTSMAVREAEIVGRLEACHHRRGSLLSEATASGVSAGTLSDLAKRISKNQISGAASKSEQGIRTAKENFRKLQSESLSNWVLAQRSLLHVSQLLEIIATGGRIQPTYEKDAPTLARGNLVDSEA